MSKGQKEFVSHFKIQVPRAYHFFMEVEHHDFDINFEDLFNMHNLYRLNTTMVRLWVCYQEQEYMPAQLQNWSDRSGHHE